MPVAVRTKSAFILAASLAVAGLASLSPSVRAADPPPAAPAASQGAAPSATVYVASSNDLMTDIKYLLMLTDTNEQKQWKVLKDYLDVFLIGVEANLPTRVDVIFDQKANRMVWSIPVSNFPKFRKDNLAAILTPRIRETENGWWKLGSGKPADFNGWLQYTPPYSRIGETKDDVNLAPVNPSKAAQALLSHPYLILADIQNKQTDAAALAKRHELFVTSRKQTVAALKKETGETAADFELKKKATEIEMDELEWFFTESEHATVGLNIDTKKEIGRVDIELTAIPNTALAQNISQLCTKPSLFANVERSKTPSLAFQINHPLGDVRKKAAVAMSSLLRDRIKARVDSDDKRTAEQKDAARQMIDKAYAMVESGINTGIADGFIDVHPGASGKNVMLAGADGRRHEARRNHQHHAQGLRRRDRQAERGRRIGRQDSLDRVRQGQAPVLEQLHRGRPALRRLVEGHAVGGRWRRLARRAQDRDQEDQAARRRRQRKSAVARAERAAQAVDRRSPDAASEEKRRGPLPEANPVRTPGGRRPALRADDPRRQQDRRVNRDPKGHSAGGR